MEDDHDISRLFKKRKKPAVPEGFFEHFYASLKDEIDARNAFSSLQLVKRERPAMPALKPVSLPGKEIKTETPRRKSKLIRLGAWSAVASAAAIVAILFYVNRTEPVAELPVAAAEPEEVIDDYVAYLDEEELIDYIIENEVTIEMAEDEIYDLVESDLEDIYMDL